jgi:IPT/TIG domain
VTIAGIGVTSHLTATASIYEQGAVVLNPSLGVAGTKINIRGGGFGSKEAVTVTAGGGVLIATVTTNAAGGFSTTYVVPATSPQGPIFIQAAGATSGVVFQSEFYVSPQLSITPKTGPAGTVITVSGHQFGANISYDIYWYYPDSQSASYLTTVTTDNTGNLSATINAPANIIAGHHYYVQVYGNERPIAQAAFLAQ